MRRFFTKGSSSSGSKEHQSKSSSPGKQSEKESPEELNEDTAEEMRKGREDDDDKPKPRKRGDLQQQQQPSTSGSAHLTSTEDLGQGDASRRPPRPPKSRAISSRKEPPEERESPPPAPEPEKFMSSRKPPRQSPPKPKPKPLPRRRGSQSQGESPSVLMVSGEGSEDDQEKSRGDPSHEEEDDEEFEEILPPRKSPKSRQTKGQGQKIKKGKIPKGHSQVATKVASEGLPGEEHAPQFINLKECGDLPKVESCGRGHYFSTVYNFKEPLPSFKIRARLLKYPTFSDQQLWSEEKMRVVDDRVFEWQEKVFSRFEVKKYQKLDNCITEQERKYYKQLSTPTRRGKQAVGKYLYTYVTDDLYVAKKKLRLLTRRCPVPHTRKEKTSYSSRLALDTSSRSLNSDGDSVDIEGGGGEGDENYYSDGGDSIIDFDDPLSSSTPMPTRKTELKDVKSSASAAEIAKQEKRAKERKEKEIRELERRNAKLKELTLKKEKLVEKRIELEQAKISEKVEKLQEIEKKEKELRALYVKKYKYSKRPSMPLGARIRNVRLTPSPGKLQRRKKSQTLSRSSEISDLQEEEDEEDYEDDLQSLQDDKKGASAKVGTEHDKYSLEKVATSSKDFTRKFADRVAAMEEKGQTMYIMASIPYLPGRCREVVVCMIQSVDGQNVLVMKPGLGYRNIETKRNTVFRLSCEVYEDEHDKEENLRRRKTENLRKSRKIGGGKDGGGGGVEDLGSFESVPKNELRLSVFGEIRTAEGFDESPLCIYYAVDIPKGWRNDSLQSNTEGMTHTCFTDGQGFAHFSHEFSFQLVFSLDFLDEPNNTSFPTPVIALMAVSMNYPSPRIVYEGYGYVTIPMTPGCHFVKIRMWKPRPRTIVERLRATFLDITPSLQDLKLVHFSSSDSGENNSEDFYYGKANLIGLQTDPTGTIKLKLNVIHQTPMINKEFDESNLDLLEKMSSATILRSVQAVIQAFQRARQKAENLKSQYD